MVPTTRLGNTPSTRTAPILMWSFCTSCDKRLGPPVPMSRATQQYSFSKFLELAFYNHSVRARSAFCTHCPHTQHVRCFGWGHHVATFRYRRVRPFNVNYTMVRGADVAWYVHARRGTQPCACATPPPDVSTASTTAHAQDQDGSEA